MNSMEHRQVYPQPAWLTDDKAVWPSTAMWALAITADTCGKSTGGRADFKQQERLNFFRSGSLTIWSNVTRSIKARQEILHILRNPTVHCRVHNSNPLVPVLSKMNTSHYHTWDSFEHHLRINSQVFQDSPFLQDSPSRLCTNFLFFLHACHIPTSVSPSLNLVTLITGQIKEPHYAAFPSLLLLALRPYLPQYPALDTHPQPIFSSQCKGPQRDNEFLTDSC